MERLRLIRCINLNLIIRRKNLIINGPPSVVLNALVPAFVFVVLSFVKLDVDCVFLLFFFHLIVIARRKRIDVANGAVHENLVVDQRRKLEATQSESHVALRSRVQEMRLTSIDAFEQLIWITLMLEIDQVLIISIDADIGVRSPRALDFFRRQLVLGLQLNLLLPLEVPTPGPLDLDGCNVVHGKAMVLEETACEGHFVGGLDDSSAEVPQALVLILVHDVEGRGEELLPELLGGRQVCTVLADRLVADALHAAAQAQAVTVDLARTLAPFAPSGLKLVDLCLIMLLHPIHML